MDDAQAKWIERVWGVPAMPLALLAGDEEDLADRVGPVIVFLHAVGEWKDDVTGQECAMLYDLRVCLANVLKRIESERVTEPQAGDVMPSVGDITYSLNDVLRFFERFSIDWEWMAVSEHPWKRLFAAAVRSAAMALQPPS